MENIIKEIEKKKIGKYIINSRLSNYTSYKVGGIAKLIIYPKNINKLIQLLQIIKISKMKFMILGNGTNTLFSDDLYNGIIIKLDLLNSLKINNDEIIVESGYNLSKLSINLSNNGLTGIEFACGIPGTIGGSIYMNAGAYNSNMSNIVKKIKVITPELKIKTLNNKNCNFKYRSSILKEKKYICVNVVLKLKKGNKNDIQSLIKEIIKNRKNSQPLEFPNAGCVFKNPKNNYAAKLIENLSLKGFKIGGAQISEKHANFIINKSNASAKDIKNLIEYIKQKVKEKYNINLKVEQELINF